MQKSAQAFREFAPRIGKLLYLIQLARHGSGFQSSLESSPKPIFLR